MLQHDHRTLSQTHALPKTPQRQASARAAEAAPVTSFRRCNSGAPRALLPTGNKGTVAMLALCRLLACPGSRSLGLQAQGSRPGHSGVPWGHLCHLCAADHVISMCFGIISSTALARRRGQVSGNLFCRQIRTNATWLLSQNSAKLRTAMAVKKAHDHTGPSDQCAP